MTISNCLADDFNYDSKCNSMTMTMTLAMTIIVGL